MPTNGMAPCRSDAMQAAVCQLWAPKRGQERIWANHGASSSVVTHTDRGWDTHTHTQLTRHNTTTKQATQAPTNQPPSLTSSSSVLLVQGEVANCPELLRLGELSIFPVLFFFFFFFSRSLSRPTVRILDRLFALCCIAFQCSGQRKPLLCICRSGLCSLQLLGSEEAVFSVRDSFC